MHSRRQLLAATGGTVLAGLAGCTDLLGDGPVTFEAEQATVPQAVRDDTGYDEADVEPVVIEETVEAGGQSQDVEVTNWQAEYDKAVELPADLPIDDRIRGAVCTVLSTPQAEVLGQAFNPIAEMRPEELLEQFQDRIEGIDNFERVGETAATMLDTATDVGRFEAEGEVGDAGVTVDVELLVSEPVASGDDFVLAIAGFPVVLADQERPDAVAMLEGVEHPS